jgi:hypothetical protein
VLVRRAVLRYVRWGWDRDTGTTDDPTFARDAELIGRCEGRHWPPSIAPLELRGVDRSMVYR